MIYLKKTQESKFEIFNLFINPFDFILEEKQLISYQIAEKICKKNNIEIPFEKKCEKWSFYHIIHKYNSFYVPIKQFYDDFKSLCYENNKKYLDFLNIIKTVTIEKTIDNKNYITTQYLYDYEKDLTSSLFDFNSVIKCDIYNIEDNLVDIYIDLFEDYMTDKNKKLYSLNNQQKQAVKNSLKNSLSIITGFPGTGKTSIVKCLLYILYEIKKEDIKIFRNNSYVNSNVSIMSPTGLAYTNIKKKCSITIKNREVYLFNVEESGTCHKTLYNIYPNILKKNNKLQEYLESVSYSDSDSDSETPNKHIPPEIIIVDEFSMMDIFMFKELLSYSNKFNVRLILIGDNNQLPSIGPGCVLNSIIETDSEYEFFKITYLKEIKRQNESSLLKNIIKMTEYGLNKYDFVDESIQFIDISSFLNKNELNEKVLIDFIKSKELSKNNTKFISYFNGESVKSKLYSANVMNLNIILQNEFNANGESIKKGLYDDVVEYRIGDIIIRTENDTNSDEFRANGEQAIIISIYEGYIYIKYFDSIKEEKIELEKFYNEFKLAYALTVHKSQGSEYKNIVIFIQNSYIWDKSSLYTAISRAEEKCFIISDYNDFLKIQKNNKNSKKPSMFLKELEKLSSYNIS